MASILKPGELTGQIITEIGAAPGPDVVTYSFALGMPEGVSPGRVEMRPGLAIAPLAAPIDYRALLVKYMRCLVESEGMTFADFLQPGENDMTEAELAELKTLAREAGDE